MVVVAAVDVQKYLKHGSVWVSTAHKQQPTPTKKYPARAGDGVVMLMVHVLPRRPSKWKVLLSALSSPT